MPQNRQTVRRSRRPSEMYNMGYVDGNTVRKLEPAPYKKSKSREQIRREREAKRRQAVRTKNQEIAVRNRAKMLNIDLKYAAFLVAAMLITLLMCIYYLNLQSQISAQNSQISTMKSQLTELTDANQATRERLNNAIDLEAVYELATSELGMDYPSEDQIIYYSGATDDYVKQYKEIPQSDK
ncbi:MAG TPA: septum formation initiator family protein [Candidatus Scybalocola faecavium]|nr:septum formation initiator family protein [Candidatus Scybalocola faecavium]